MQFYWLENFMELLPPPASCLNFSRESKYDAGRGVRGLDLWLVSFSCSILDSFFMLRQWTHSVLMDREVLKGKCWWKTTMKASMLFLTEELQMSKRHLHQMEQRCMLVQAPVSFEWKWGLVSLSIFINMFFWLSS